MSRLEHSKGYNDLVFCSSACVWMEPPPVLGDMNVTPRMASAVPEQGREGEPRWVAYDARVGTVFWVISAMNPALAWIQVDELCSIAGYNRAGIGLRPAEEGFPIPAKGRVENELLRAKIRSALLGRV